MLCSSLNVQRYIVVVDFLLTHDLYINTIMGLKWLSNLGWMLTHWDLLLLKF